MPNTLKVLPAENMHDEYTLIADTYTKMMDAVAATLTGEKEQLGLVTYLMDYRTIRIGGPRQTGITSWVLNHVSPQSIIVTASNITKHTLRDMVAARDHGEQPTIESAFDLCNTDLVQPVIFDRVYVLDATVVLTRFQRLHTKKFINSIGKYLNEESVIYLIK